MGSGRKKKKGLTFHLVSATIISVLFHITNSSASGESQLEEGIRSES